MKYKRGSIVEVFTTDEVHCHSWRCAQIVSGNGHDYTVSYDVYPGFTDEADVGLVSEKSIRPCPPLVEIPESWVAGDEVEVFHNLSWKMAIVLKAMGWDQFLVRLVGSFQVFEVIKSELRLRQSWQNGEWVLIGKKVPRHIKDGKQDLILKHIVDPGSQDKQMDPKGNFYMKHIRFDAQNNNFLDSRILSSKTMKRGSPCRPGEPNEESAHKIKVAEKEGRCFRVLCTSLQKVDTVANTREMLCEEDKHTSFENQATQFYQANMERQNINGNNGCSSVTSSVGSCSIEGYKPYEMYRESDIEGHDSDAESVCQSGNEEGVGWYPSKEALAAEIHRLELHAYRPTMEALHASGPLNWEKETMGQRMRLVHFAFDYVHS